MEDLSSLANIFTVSVGYDYFNFTVILYSNCLMIFLNSYISYLRYCLRREFGSCVVGMKLEVVGEKVAGRLVGEE
jgi:hypothetical protein